MRKYHLVRPVIRTKETLCGRDPDYAKTHFWIGDARVGDGPKDSVLCLINDPDKFMRWRTREFGPFTITIDKKGVTCRACLELIHA